jgi:dihydrofolate reductase
MVTLYNVISADGFIARKDDSEDFIPDEMWPVTLEMYRQYDTLVMGRKTYDVMQKYPKELIGPFNKLSLKKVVVTHDEDFHPDSQLGYVVIHTPEEALTMGTNVLVSSGPILNTYLLEKSLIDKIIFHKVPAKIGEGIKPFNLEFKDTFIPTSEKELPNSVKELTYQVATANHRVNAVISM